MVACHRHYGPNGGDSMIVYLPFIGVVLLVICVFLCRHIPWVRRVFMLDFCQGLSVTARELFKPKKTIQYPEEQLPLSPRFRGLLALRRYDNGEERCIACRLCEAVCPALAITIEAEPRDDGSRRTKRFDIDVFKCINCGLCEEACPVDSIVATPVAHYHITKRGDNILSKHQLLALGDAFEQDIQAAKAADQEGERE